MLTPVYPRFVGVRQLFQHEDTHDSSDPHKYQALTISGMDYRKEIGRRIKGARNEKGWSLVELSRRTNDLLSDTRIGNYETGERMPGPAEAAILAKTLGKRAAYFLAVDDTQLPISAQEEALIRNWRTLNERERMEFFRQIEAMAMASRDPVSNAKVEKHFPSTKRQKTKA